MRAREREREREIMIYELTILPKDIIKNRAESRILTRLLKIGGSHGLNRGQIGKIGGQIAKFQIKSFNLM